MLSREQVIESIEENKIIAILRGIPQQKLIPLAEALYQGGIRLLEITYAADGSVSDEETADNIKKLAEQMKGKMLIGAGTVLTKEQVRLTEQAGGTFIISPNVNEEVIKESCRCGLVSIPGALTPTEIENASRSGADFVKLFPVTNMGPGYVKAVKAPLSHIRLLAVGGINESNMKDYLAAGVCGFGIGSNITDKKLIADNNYEKITLLSKAYVEAVKNA